MAEKKKDVKMEQAEVGTGDGSEVAEVVDHPGAAATVRGKRPGG